jgi:hypothetical protein
MPGTEQGLNVQVITLNDRLRQETGKLTLWDRLDRLLPKKDNKLPVGKDPNQWAVEQLLEVAKQAHIEGVQDTEGYARVQEIFRVAKKANGAVDTWEKAAKADANAYREMIGGYAKPLSATIQTIKDEVNAKMQAIDREKARLMEEQEEADRLRFERRVEGLMNLGLRYNESDHVFYVPNDPGRPAFSGIAPALPEDLVRMASNKALRTFMIDRIMPFLPSKEAVQRLKRGQERVDQVSHLGGTAIYDKDGYYVGVIVGPETFLANALGELDEARWTTLLQTFTEKLQQPVPEHSGVNATPEPLTVHIEEGGVQDVFRESSEHDRKNAALSERRLQVLRVRGAQVTTDKEGRSVVVLKSGTYPVKGLYLYSEAIFDAMVGSLRDRQATLERTRDTLPPYPPEDATLQEKLDHDNEVVGAALDLLGKVRAMRAASAIIQHGMDHYAPGLSAVYRGYEALLKETIYEQQKTNTNK